MNLPIFLIAGAVGSGGGVVNLAGGTFVSADAISGYNTTSGIRLSQFGDLFKGTAIDTDTVSWVKQSVDTDWIFPHLAGGGQFEVRVTGVTGTFTTAAAANDVWIALSVNRTWTVDRNTAGTSTVSFTLEIRNNGGATLASTAYSIACQNT